MAQFSQSLPQSIAATITPLDMEKVFALLVKLFPPDKALGDSEAMALFRHCLGFDSRKAFLATALCNAFALGQYRHTWTEARLIGDGERWIVNITQESDYPIICV